MIKCAHFTCHACDPERKDRLEGRLQDVTDSLKDSVRAEFAAVDVRRLKDRVQFLEDQNEQLRAALTLSAEINPYGSIENAEARDMARSLLYQVPALPVDPEAERIVEDLVRRRKVDKADAVKKLRRRED